MSGNAARTAERIEQGGVVAILRGSFEGRALIEVAQAIAAAGVSAIELTLNSSDALRGIRELSRELGDSVLIGAGTVRSGDAAERAIEAGATFLVSPHFGRDVSGAAHAADTLLVPGVLTPTEAQAAIAAGHRVLKLFPADVGGPGYMRSLMAPLDDARFVPTGGVGPDNARAYIAAGAVAVGVGSELTHDYPDLDRVAEVARRVVQAVRAGRESADRRTT